MKVVLVCGGTSESLSHRRIMEPKGNQVRVLWVIKGLGVGGAERLLVETAQLADRSRFTFEVAYLIEQKDQLRQPLAAAGVVSHCLHSRHEANLGWAHRLRALVREQRYDIVHVHSPYVASVARVALRLLPKSTRPVLFYTEHNNWASHSRLTRLANRCTAWLDDARFAVSRDALQSMPRSVRASTEVIIQGISMQRFQQSHSSRAKTRRSLGLGDDDILALTVANLRAVKGYPDLLEAARLAVMSVRKHHGSRLRFAAVGQGPLKEQIIEQHRRLELGDDFLLLGQRSDIVELLHAGDLFVLSSHFEGLPLALLEALAAGLPAVVTSVGDIPDVVREGIEGRVIPPRRPDLLAAAIVELAGDPRTRSRLSAAALSRGSDFDVAHSVHRLQQHYARWS